MMKVRLFTVALGVGVMALVGCGDSSSSSDTAGGDTGGTTDTAADTGGTPTDTGGTGQCGDPIPAQNTNVSVAPNIGSGSDVAQLTGVDRSGETCTEPTRSPTCTGPSYQATNAFAYPWCGSSNGSDTYTCNGCPDGHPLLQGRFRAMGFCDAMAGDPDVDTPVPSDFAELLFIEGNTWYARIKNGSNNSDYEARGWYFCSEQPENSNAHLFWVTTEVITDTSGTAQVGDTIRTDVPLDAGDGPLLFYFNELMGSDAGVNATYCKIGETVNGEECYDPFTRL